MKRDYFLGGIWTLIGLAWLVGIWFHFGLPWPTGGNEPLWALVAFATVIGIVITVLSKP